VVDAGFDASGCGAIIASGSAAVQLVRGEALFDAARVSTSMIAAELGGVERRQDPTAADLAADALHRAIGLAAIADAEIAPSADPHACSHVRRSRFRRCRAADEGDAVAVTLELWRDPENDGESSCCSASAVRVARAVAHKMGMAHFTLDLRDEFRDGVVTPWL